MRAIRRALFLILWTLVAIPVQAVLVALPGRGKIVFARVYWAGVCRLIGLQCRVIGQRGEPDGRPVVYVSNHSSWLDIPVLGGRLEACFIAKDEVASWPVIGRSRGSGRTVFVRRQRGTTGRERDDMRASARAAATT